jgi:hypothetical protein
MWGEGYKEEEVPEARGWRSPGQIRGESHVSQSPRPGAEVVRQSADQDLIRGGN